MLVTTKLNKWFLSQSPFGFWGDWNAVLFMLLVGVQIVSQSPFGFWGDWNARTAVRRKKFSKIVTIAFRLLGWLELINNSSIENNNNFVTIAFRLLGWLELNIFCFIQFSKSFVTIAFRLLGWLELFRTGENDDEESESQSPFGFWGDWNSAKRSRVWKVCCSCHNRLSAFGVIGTEDYQLYTAWSIIESQSPFGFWGDWNGKCARRL